MCSSKLDYIKNFINDCSVQPIFDCFIFTMRFVVEKFHDTYRFDFHNKYFEIKYHSYFGNDSVHLYLLWEEKKIEIAKKNYIIF